MYYLRTKVKQKPVWATNKIKLDTLLIVMARLTFYPKEILLDVKKKKKNLLGNVFESTEESECIHRSLTNSFFFLLMFKKKRWHILYC